VSNDSGVRPAFGRAVLIVSLTAGALLAAEAPASGPASRPAIAGRVIRVADQPSLMAVLKDARGGDTILVAPGHYEGFAFTRKFPDGRPLIIRSAERHKAVFDRGRTLYFWGVENVVFEGFELARMQMDDRGAQGLIHVEGQSRNVTLRDLYAHHAGFNDDCIKINAARNIDVLDCILHDPGMREGGQGPQETLDYYDVDGGRIAGNLFTGGTSRQYINAKAGSRDIVIDSNILLGHHGAAGDEAIVLGGWSGTVRGDYEGVNITVRNNLVIGSRSGAFQVRNVRGGYIYNNLVLNCTRSPLIQAVTGKGKGSEGGSEDVYVFNNIFCNSGGDMPPLMQVVGTFENFHHGHNLYFNGAQPIPSEGYYDPRREPGAVFDDPLVHVATRGGYRAILESLAISASSLAVEAGTAPPAGPAGVPADIRGTRRPRSKAYDIGPLEQ
jgi:hypothetical protein